MLNQASLIGHSGGDPEMIVLDSGVSITRFSVATTEKWKTKEGEQKEATEWHRCTVFGKLAEVCNDYIKKGSRVFVQGRINTKKYTDKNGVERWSTQIIVNKMKLLDRKPAGELAKQEHTHTAKDYAAASGRGDVPPDDFDDDIPF